MNMQISHQKRLILLVITLLGVALLSAGLAIFILYRTALIQQETRLIETVQSQARLIEAMAASAGPEETLAAMRVANQNFIGFAKTGEFVIGERQNDQINFLLSIRHDSAIPNSELPQVAWFDEGGESVRRAIDGQSGTLIDVDYRRERVLAAYEHVQGLRWGLIAKIDMAEIRAPFIEAASYTLMITLSIAALGAYFFIRLTNPLLTSLEASELRNRVILETAPDGIITFNQSGKIQNINRAAQNIFGYETAKAQGEKIEKLIPAFQNSEFIQQIQARKFLKEHQERELLGRHRSGKLFSLALALSKAETQQTAHFYTIIVRDITERKQIEKALEKAYQNLEDRVEERTQALLETDVNLQEEIGQREQMENRIRRINEAFLNFSNRPLENINHLTALCGELLGADVALYNRLNDQALLCSLGQWQTPADYDPVFHPKGHICQDVLRMERSEILFVPNLPQTIYAQTDPAVLDYQLQTYMGHPVKYQGKTVGSFCVLFQEDFAPSEDDKHLMSILASAIGIEDERLQTEAILAQTRDQALEASRFKSELLGKVSHELRTPLSAILGFTEMLEEGLYGPLSEDQHLATQQIIEGANYLSLLIEDLLDQVKLDAGQFRLNIQPFEPQSILVQIEHQMQILAQAKKLKLHTWVDPNLPTMIQGDPRRLQQVLVNLISNAIKFTETGAIHVRFHQSDEQHWLIEVEDTGVGIPPEAQTTIFEPFNQVDGSATRQQGGTGLGLSIVKQLVELMDGELRLSSWPGEGSRFTITLPLIKPF